MCCLQYGAAMRMANACVTDTPLSAEEAQVIAVLVGTSEYSRRWADL